MACDSTNLICFTSATRTPAGSQPFNPLDHLQSKTIKLSQSAFQQIEDFLSTRAAFFIKNVKRYKYNELTLKLEISRSIAVIQKLYYNDTLTSKTKKDIKTLKSIKASIATFGNECFDVSRWFNEIIKNQIMEKHPQEPVDNNTGSPIKHKYYQTHFEPCFKLFQQVIHHLMLTLHTHNLLTDFKSYPCESGGLLFFYPDDNGFFPIATNPQTTGLEVILIAYGSQTHAFAPYMIGEQMFLFNRGVQEKRSGCLVHAVTNPSPITPEFNDFPYRTSVMGIFGENTPFPFHVGLITPMKYTKIADHMLTENHYDILALVILILKPQLEEILRNQQEDYLFIPMPNEEEEEERLIVTLLCLEALEKLHREETFALDLNGQSSKEMPEVLSPSTNPFTEMKKRTLSAIEQIMEKNYQAEWDKLQLQRQQEEANRAKKKKNKKGQVAAIEEEINRSDFQARKAAFMKEKFNAIRLHGKKNYTSLVNLITRMIQSTPNIKSYLSTHGSHTTIHIKGGKSTTLVIPHGGHETKFSEDESYTIIHSVLDAMGNALRKTWD